MSATSRGVVTVLLACVSQTIGVSAAWAADTATLDQVEVYPTFAAAGVYADFTGDDDGDLRAWVEYRAAGAADFQRGHDLMLIAPGRLAGSVFFLEPATTYDLRIVLDDPDNGGPLTQDEQATTRVDEPAAPTGTSLWVDAEGGSANGDGSQANPFDTIGAAAAIAQPGEVVHVLPGVYRESIDPPDGGADGAPLWFIAEGPGVIIDGSDAALTQASWTDEGGGIYSTAFAGDTEYLAVDDDRIYDYQSLAELQSEAAGLPGGFFVDSGAGRLYLRLPDGSDPSSHLVHVAVLDTGFLLDTISHVVVDGFEFRYLGGTRSGVAVDVRDSSRCWVRNNTAHHMNAGFRVRRPLASENVIEHNSFRDTSVFGWPWDAVKAHTPEASAIGITDGRGNVVRYNTVEGSFNGIYTCQWATTDESIAKDTDVYGNLMIEHGDDGLEPEGACVNVRFWHNVLRSVYNDISVSPIETGPTWFVRTLIYDYDGHVFKVNNGSTGWILVYHTTGVPRASEADAQALSPSLPFGPFITRNNIWQANRYVIESMLTTLNPGVDWDHDALWTTATDRFVKWEDIRYDTIAELIASDTIEQHGLQIEPQYDDAASGDFNLIEGHELIDQGLLIDGINTMFVVGAGPDTGAFERGGVNPWEDAPPGTGGGTSSGAGGSSSGTGGAGTGGSGAAAGQDGADDDGGCGCRTAPASDGSWSIVLWGTLTLGLGHRRRARGRARW